MSMPGSNDLQFMNAYIQKLSGANYQLTQRIYILETQLEIANQKLKKMENTHDRPDDGFGGADVEKHE